MKYVYCCIFRKQREDMFGKMLNECLALDNELGKLVARRLNGESMSLLDSKRYYMYFKGLI